MQNEFYRLRRWLEDSGFNELSVDLISGLIFFASGVLLLFVYIFIWTAVPSVMFTLHAVGVIVAAYRYFRWRRNNKDLF